MSGALLTLLVQSVVLMELDESGFEGVASERRELRNFVSMRVTAAAPLQI